MRVAPHLKPAQLQWYLTTKCPQTYHGPEPAWLQVPSNMESHKLYCSFVLFSSKLTLRSQKGVLHPPCWAECFQLWYPCEFFHWSASIAVHAWSLLELLRWQLRLRYRWLLIAPRACKLCQYRRLHRLSALQSTGNWHLWMRHAHWQCFCDATYSW